MYSLSNVMEQNIWKQKQHKTVPAMFGKCRTLLSESVSCDLLFKCRTIPFTDLEKTALDSLLQNRAGPSYMGYKVLLWATSFSVKLFNYSSNGIQWRVLYIPFASPLVGCCCLFPDYVLEKQGWGETEIVGMTMPRHHSFSLPRILKLHQNIINGVILIFC